jgi:protein phosphatase 1 regulatory subunit 37
MPASPCSPSSSAITIPIPGKSILKRPQSQPASLLSRITRFLPNPNQTQIDESKPLKRAHFILPYLATVYPISSLNPPSTPSLKEEKKAIEDKEAERRRRIIRGGSLAGSSEDHGHDWWNLDKVESFYRECCVISEEEPDPTISLALKVRV